MSQDENNDLNANAAALKEVDAYLAEADPDFLKNLSDLKGENSETNLSILDEGIDYAALEKQGLPEPKRKIIEQIMQIFNFRSNLKVVLFFWISTALIGAMVYVAWNSKIWDRRSSLFLTSFEALGAPVEDFDPATDTQYFFDNPRLAKNIVSLRKMLVNLKASPGQSEGAMLAFEISIEGMTQEVVIEIKDRESEFTDRALRIAEGFTYEDLVSKEGKQKMTDAIKQAYNTNLTRGQVRRVLYASFILKN